MEEIWKDIEGYEGLYQVSSVGIVKSLKRLVNSKHSSRTVNEIILKQSLNKWGYYAVGLHKYGKVNIFRVHRLVAVAFIHNTESKPCINHINAIKTDNRAENLEWCTIRENTSHYYSQQKSTSQYVGVILSRNKWNASIYHGGKKHNLGWYPTEIEASIAYQKALKEIKETDNLTPYKNQKWSSKYKGVSLDKVTNRWCSYILVNGKRIWLGSFKTEIDAHQAYQNKLNTLCHTN